MPLITLGLDLSLTHTGYVVLQEEGEVISSGVIKSKPSGDTPTDELRRILEIVAKLEEIIDENLFDRSLDLVMIENLAFMAKNTTALTQLSGLNYFVRGLLFKKNVPFVLVAPTSLKKFVTGSGKGDKDKMMMSIFKDYGFEGLDDNEADAFALAACGLFLLGAPINKPNKAQSEVIKLLEKQLEE